MTSKKWEISKIVLVSMVGITIAICEFFNVCVCKAFVKGKILLSDDFQNTELEKHFAYKWLFSSAQTIDGLNVAEYDYDYLNNLCSNINFDSYNSYVIVGKSSYVEVYLVSCSGFLAYSTTSSGDFCRFIFSAEDSSIPVYRRIRVDDGNVIDYGEQQFSLSNRTSDYYYQDLGLGSFCLISTSCVIYDCIEFYDGDWNYRTQNYYYNVRCLTEGTNLNCYTTIEDETSETINNHMYMLSCDVGFCGNKIQGDMSGFSSTYVYFDYALDKYAQGHCDDYLLHINYRLNVDGRYYDYAYITGISASGYFLQSLSDLNFTSGVWNGTTVTAIPLNGIFLDYQKQKLCIVSVADLKTCELTVACYMSGTTASMSSGQFVKRFDLINGQSTVDRNEIIENKNPFEENEDSSITVGGASVNQSNTQTVTFPNTINVNVNQGNTLPNVTIEDDDMSFTSLAETLKTGFGILDDVDTGVKGDGFPAMLGYLYNGLPEPFSKMILLGVSSVTAIAILLRLLGRK